MKVPESVLFDADMIRSRHKQKEMLINYLINIWMPNLREKLE